nr:hypothetical protein [Tanacetum cinerariifolium]
MRLHTDIKPKEATFQVVMGALALTLFYQAFLITADVATINMQEFWATVSIHKSSIRFRINKKKFSLDVEIFRVILQFCPKIPRQELKTFHWNKIFYLSSEILGTVETSLISLIHEKTQVYGSILRKELTNQAMLGYKTYYAFALGEKTPKPKCVRKKADSDTFPKQKLVHATKGNKIKNKAKVAKSNKKKQPSKKRKAKRLDVLSEVALTEVEQLKLATKRSKKDFHISHCSGIKQVNQYAQALSFIPAIVDHYMDNKLGEAINKAEVNTQLPQILPQAISDVATLVIEKNVTKSLEATVLTRSSSQPQSSYEAAATLSEFELTKILIDKMENKNHLMSQDDKDKDQDPSAGSDRGTKRKKSSKDVESFRDSKSKEKKSSSISKDTSQSQHKSFGKSAHAEEPSHTVEDLGMQQDQEFVMRENDEQPVDKEVTKADWFKKPKRLPTHDPDWSKRQQVDFRPP